MGRVHGEVGQVEEERPVLVTANEIDGAVGQVVGESLAVMRQDVPIREAAGALRLGPLDERIVIPQGIRRVLPALVNQFIALLKGSALVYFLGLIAGQRELFQVGRDLNAQTGNLSPLVAAGLFYLILTIPLTHLVNYIDARLRKGKPAEPEDPLSPLNPASSQEMI